MPRLIVTETAVRGIARCRGFLQAKSTSAADRAARQIGQRLLLLEQNAEIGRPLAGDPELRELVVPFGDAGYVALYRFVPTDDTVVVLAFRHQREAGY